MFSREISAYPLPDLLDLVQRRTLDYFWIGCHPESGLPYDRRLSEKLAPNDLISIAGTGFSALAIIVGVSRHWITRLDACHRVSRILSYLERSPKFHGAFAHFVNGSTGQSVAFSKYDDGGDIVETSLLMQGLICAREYFDGSCELEASLRIRINDLYRQVDWNWYTRGGCPTLYWHWSPNYDWHMNVPVTGWNEGLIAYVLAAGALENPIAPEAYHRGWAGSQDFRKGEVYHGCPLPAGPPFGGPLFLSQYSYCGLDPQGLSESHMCHWEQAVSHARINHRHCMVNPFAHDGYGNGIWGLTASDGPVGYTVSCPVNDYGIVAPTAALSSFPFVPTEAEAALRAFLKFGEGRLLGRFGFVDAFKPAGDWIADTHLAINQGPIIAMIEHYRTGLL